MSVALENRLLSESLKNKLISLKGKTKDEVIIEAINKIIEIAKSTSFDEEYDRNFTILSDGSLTFLPKGKECVLGENGFTWTRKNRISARQGKAFRKLFLQSGINTLEDTHIEQLVNLLRSKFVDGTFKVVSGSELTDIYSNPDIADCNTGSLEGSCMNGNSRSYFEIYEDLCEMLILVNSSDELMGRALLWETDCGTKVMDRIYTSDANMGAFKDWASDNGYWHKAHQSYDDPYNWVDTEGEERESYFKISVEKRYRYYPYLDTFKYSYDLSDCLRNDCGYDKYVLDSTDGGVSTHEEEVWDDVDDCYIFDSDSVYINSTTSTNFEGYTHIDNAVEAIDGHHYLEVDVIELNCGRYALTHFDDIKEVDGEWYHIDDLRYCAYNNMYFLEDEVTDVSNYSHMYGYVLTEDLEAWANEEGIELNKD